MWETRLAIEMSRSVKCGSVAHQLVGTKKVQEVLTRPGQVERFVGKTTAEKIRRTFVALHALDMTEKGNAALQNALTNPCNYVLKPQREGSDSNLFNQDIVNTLKEIGDDKQRCGYILMDKIRPTATRNYIVASGKATPARVLGEPGIYGGFLATGNTFLMNSAIGHMFRVKKEELIDNNAYLKMSLSYPLLTEE